MAHRRARQRTGHAGSAAERRSVATKHGRPALMGSWIRAFGFTRQQRGRFFLQSH